MIFLSGSYSDVMAFGTYKIKCMKLRENRHEDRDSDSNAPEILFNDGYYPRKYVTSDTS